MENNEFDIICVGAGILGCAAAFSLASDPTKQILLVERDLSKPDRIVGELLQPGGIKALEILGMADCVEGIDGIVCEGYDVIKSEENVLIKYPSSKEYPKPRGISFHHGEFVMKLREKCKTRQNITMLEGTCTELIKCPLSEQYLGIVCKEKKTGLKSRYFADLTVVGDGCFSSFRKQFTEKTPSTKSHFVGLILKDCVLPNPNHGHVVLAKPSPILLYQISTTDTRMLVDIPNPIPKTSNGDMQAYLTDVVGPQLPESVKTSFYKACDEPVRSMPCSWLPPTQNKSVGAIFLGDAQNMRHPLTGGGMTVAFWDVIHLKEILDQCENLKDHAKVSKELEKLHWKRKNLSSVVNILANALYDLFSAGDDPYVSELQNACFEYFKLGGRCVDTPVSLLAGILPQPMTLMGHFFAVALYGIFLMICCDSWYKIPLNVVKSVAVLYNACVIFFPLLYAECV